MQQVGQLFLIAGIAITGYLVVPLLGAFRVRRQWRNFREALYASMEYPVLSYRVVRSTRQKGLYRFFGRIEAVQGSERLWLNNGRLSVQVDLEGLAVYTLPADTEFHQEGRVENNEISFADVPPTFVHSSKISSFPQGTDIFVSGTLFYENSRPVFRAAQGAGLLVLIYDGDVRTVLRRSIWAGRQRNEYLNQFSPLSFTLASFSLFILAYIFLRTPRLQFYAHLALTMSLLPAAPLLPPGLLLYSLYRRIWRTGRYLRAERDLLVLPARRFFSDSMIRDGASTRLPDGGSYRVMTFEGMQNALVGCPDSKIRSTKLLGNADLQHRRFYGFGCAENMPEVFPDPFAEPLLVPGNPRELSRRCSRGARQREISAAILFLTALGINSTGIFILLWFFVM